MNDASSHPESTPTPVESVEGNNRWPSVAIVVLNWNGYPLLSQYLPSLMGLDYPDYRVVVVDNASTDESVPFIHENFPQVDLIVHDENLGFGPGLNAAVPQIEADIIVLLNNDVDVRSDWLKALVTPMQADPAIGVAGCKLLYPDGQTIQHAGANLSYPLAYSQHRHYQQPDTEETAAVTDVSYVTGAAMAISRQVLGEIGLFAPELAPFYYEEVDFCYRVREAGYRVVYVPAAVAIHHESFSVRQLSEWHLFYFHKNRLRFVLKHYTRAQFFNDFVPAELARLQQPAGPAELYQVRRAYLLIRLALPEILRRRGELEVLTRYEAAFNRLRQAAISRRPDIEAHRPDNPLETELQEKQAIEEFAFTEDKPVIGRLIAGIRRACLNVAAKWAIRSVIQQQTAFNRLVSRLLGEQDRQHEAMANEINLMADELTAVRVYHEAQMAAAEAELNALQQRVTQLEAALAKAMPDIERAAQE